MSDIDVLVLEIVNMRSFEAVSVHGKASWPPDDSRREVGEAKEYA